MPGKIKGLAHWCKKVTEGYRGGEVTDMSSSWKNGLAFCAIIHRFRPHLIDYGSLSPENIFENNSLAFTIAENEFGIMSLLDPKDMLEMTSPDRMSIATYVSQIYDYFKDEQIVDREVEYKYKPQTITSDNGHLEASPKEINETDIEVRLNTNSDRDNSSLELITQDTSKANESNDAAMTAQNLDEISGIIKTTKKDSISDIDDIFKANEALLQSHGEGEDTQIEKELENKHNSVVCKPDRSNKNECGEIYTQENGTYMSDAVHKAAVCAGIAAVAITAGDDTETAVSDTEITDSNAERVGSDTEMEIKHNVIEYEVESTEKIIDNDTKRSLPEIQIMVMKEETVTDNVTGTLDLEEAKQEADILANLEAISPDVETKIKTMHQQSLATSSSDSFQSTECEVTVENNDKARLRELYVEDESENIGSGDHLILVLNEVDTSTGLTVADEHVMKHIKSSSTESFTSTSSLATTDSEKSSLHNDGDARCKENASQSSPKTPVKSLKVPDKDSETEIFDEEDDEPPALPTIGPPPLSEQTEMPYIQQEVVIQGELEVLCAEPASIVKAVNYETQEIQEPIQKSSIMEKSVSEDSKSFSVLSVDTVSDRNSENLSADSGVQKEILVDCLSDAVLTDQLLHSPVTSPDIDPGNETANIELLSELSVDTALTEAVTERAGDFDTLDDDSKSTIVNEIYCKDKLKTDNKSSGTSLNEDATAQNRAMGVSEAYVTLNEDNSSEMSNHKNDAQTEHITSSAGQDVQDCIKDLSTESKVTDEPSAGSRAGEDTSGNSHVRIDETDLFENVALELKTVSEDVQRDIKQSMVCRETEQEMMPTETVKSSDRLKHTSASEIAVNPVSPSSFKNCELNTYSTTKTDSTEVNELGKEALPGERNTVLPRHSHVASTSENIEIRSINAACDAVKTKADTCIGNLEGKQVLIRKPVKKDKYADVDVSLLKKAKEMSKKMAEKRIEMQYSPRSPTEENNNIGDTKINKDSVSEQTMKEATPEAQNEQAKEEMKTRKMEILRQVQRSTRPTKKNIEAAEFEARDSFSDSSTEFKSKMMMWNRKSSTAQEPDEVSLSSGSSTPDSASRKSFTGFPSSPVCTPTSPIGDYSNLQRLTQSLPSKPRPGSVAEYVRKISQSSQYKPASNSENISPDDGEIVMREKPPTETKDKAVFRRSTGDISPAFRLSRPTRLSQPINVSVKPLVQRYSETDVNKQKNSNVSVFSPKPPKRSGDFAVVVKPLSEKYALSDEESKLQRDEEKKATLERKDSLTRRNPPRRNLSITRPRSRSSSRERNIWQHDYTADVITSPAVEKESSVTRRESFEVKVRPVSLQISDEEKKEDKEKWRRHSLSSTITQANSPVKDVSKVNISVQPLSPVLRTRSSCENIDSISHSSSSNTSKHQVLSSSSTVSDGIQERKSRPRTTLAPKWTSKVNTKQAFPKSESLSITAKRPGRSVLNYVQSCLQQKTPKEKAAVNRRPATFSSADISKPTVIHKESMPHSVVTEEVRLKEPIKKDSVSICNSIFGSKSKMKVDKGKTDELKGSAAGNGVASTTSLSASSSSSLNDELVGHAAVVIPDCQIDQKIESCGSECENVQADSAELIKQQNVHLEENAQKVSDTDTCSEVRINGISEALPNTEAIVLPNVSGSTIERPSSSSSESSSSDSNDDKDLTSLKSSSGTSLPDQNITASLRSSDNDNKALEIVGGPQSSGTSLPDQNITASLISSDNDNRALEIVEGPQLSNIQSLDTNLIPFKSQSTKDTASFTENKEGIVSLTEKEDMIASQQNPDSVNSCCFDTLPISCTNLTSTTNTSNTESTEKKNEVLYPGVETTERLPENKEVIVVESSPNLIATSYHSVSVDEKMVVGESKEPVLLCSVENALHTECHKGTPLESDQSLVAASKYEKGFELIDDDEIGAKILLQTAEVLKSEPDSSESEEKGMPVLQSLSSHSTSSASSAEIEKPSHSTSSTSSAEIEKPSYSTPSTSVAEIEKPELKEGLKNIISELEKEIENEKEDSAGLQIINVDVNYPASCVSSEIRNTETEPAVELTMTDMFKTGDDPDKDVCGEVSEKDLFEDFENLVCGLKKDEELAKELDVVVEDETEEEIQKEPVLHSQNLAAFSQKNEKNTETGSECYVISNADEVVEDLTLAVDIEAAENIPEVTIAANDEIENKIDISCGSSKLIELESDENRNQKGNLDKNSVTIYHSDKINEKSMQSSSSSSSSSSFTSETVNKEDDDELLKNVIEDSQPFRAPLLEEIIDSKKIDVSHSVNKNLNEASASLAACSLDGNQDKVAAQDQTSKQIQESKENQGHTIPRDNVNPVSIIEGEDPIILSAVADANGITSPLEVKVSVFESSFEVHDRMSPVLFSEEEVLKQHGFADIGVPNIDETLEADPVLLSAIVDAKAEDRKRKARKDSTSSDESLCTEYDNFGERQKQIFTAGDETLNDEESQIENCQLEESATRRTKTKSESSSSSSKKSTESHSSISTEEVKEVQEASDLEQKTENQSAQSENESEDGMKYEFRGKDGNCYLLLDNDPTSPVAKTLIAKEKEKAENLKNSSLSSMSDEQIQDAIDSINMKHSEYIPVSGISVSLKNPEYFLDPHFGPFEVEIIEPQLVFVSEDKTDDTENKVLDSEESMKSQPESINVNSKDELSASDLDKLTAEQTSENKSRENEIVGNEPVTEAEYNTVNLLIEDGEQLHTGSPNTSTEVTDHCSVPLKSSYEKSESESSSSGSRDATVNNSKKKKRKYTKRKRPDSLENLNLKISKSSSSSSDSENEAEKASKKKRVPDVDIIESVSSQFLCDDKGSDGRESKKKKSRLLEQGNNELALNKPDQNLEFATKISGVPSDSIVASFEKKEKLKNNDEESNNRECEKKQTEMFDQENSGQTLYEPNINTDFSAKTPSVSSNLLLDSERKEKLQNDTLKLDDITTSKNETLRHPNSTNSSDSTSDSNSNSESSESADETDKRFIKIDTDTISISKTKSKVYHSDENLNVDNSDESESNIIEVKKDSEQEKPLELETVVKTQETPISYENWPLNFKELETKSEELPTVTCKNEDLHKAEKFLIGREKDPSKSEVARLIQQSLDQDRKRDEIRRIEQERYKELQDKLLPRDEVLEHEHIRHLSETSSTGSPNKEDDQVDLDESSGAEDEIQEMGEDVSEELLAGEATPMSMPSMDEVSSPDEQPEKSVVEVFDLQESSGDDISPDMESQALFVKLKEAQCKNAVLEAEMAKLKAKIIVLENTEGQKRQYEKKCEEMAARLLEMEKKVTSARKEINHYQDMMEGSQGQYIALEKKMQGDVTAIEKKYHKAKKIIKEYQQREKDFLAERESLLQQQTEKDQQYNALVKSLKDRIFQLERELAEAQRAAGLPVLVPSPGTPHSAEESLKKDSLASEIFIAKTTSPVVQSARPFQDFGSPLLSPTTETASVSSESDISASEPTSLEGDLEDVTAFESIPKTELLDTSANRNKAQLASAIPSRRPPTKQRPKSQESIEGADNSTERDRESGLDSWTKHESEDTVKKSDLKKRKAQQEKADVSEKGRETPPPDTLPPPPPPPSHPPPSLPDSDDGAERHRDRQGSSSGESSSTVSQTSYDPSKPSFLGMDSEIPASDTVSVDTAGTADSGSSAGATGSTTFSKKSKGIKIPKLPFKFGGSDKDTGGVVLVSNRSLNSEEDLEGGVTLISKKKLDTNSDFDGASTISDVSSGYMVGELDEGGKSSSYNFSGTPANEENPSQPSHHNQNQISSGAISQWNNEHVCHWLMGIEMDKYTPLFKEKSITGVQLAMLDANRLKALGITNAKDRETLKKKIKELKVALDKERKQMERERKMQEKEQKAREKEQKKLSKKK